MWRHGRQTAGSHLASVTVLAAAALTMLGCGAAPSPRLGDLAAPASGLYIDWDYHDWCLDRYIVDTVRERRSGLATIPEAVQLAYRDAVTYGAPWDSVSLISFLSLEPAEQHARRREAQDSAHRARRTVLSVIGFYRNRYDRSAGATLDDVDVALAPSGSEHALTDAIGDLVAATGTDPSNPAAWRDLAYFCGTVGDRPRQQRALASCLAALDQAPPTVAALDDARRLRRDVLLDLAWLARDLGQPAVTVAYLDHLKPWLDAPGREAEERRYEADLLRGLALADQGEWLAAVSQARELPRLRVTTRTLAGGSPRNDTRWFLSAPHFMTLGFDRAAWPRQPSDFGRRWIKALAGAPTGESSHVLWLLGPPPTHLELPARLASRFWQDQGRLYAAAGERETSLHCYEWAALYRPYSMFFPLEGHEGRARGGLPAYFLGYGTFFLCGDRGAYERAADELVTERQRTDFTPD